MRTIEASGKTIDEAIFNGLKELEVSIDEVEIDIVQHETKGILGIGAKPAIVKLTEREPEQIVVPDYMNEAERRANRRREDRPRRDDRTRRDRGNRRDERPHREDKPQRSEEAAEVKEETVTVAEEISENGEVRKEIVEEVSEVGRRAGKGTTAASAATAANAKNRAPSPRLNTRLRPRRTTKPRNSSGKCSAL